MLDHEEHAQAEETGGLPVGRATIEQIVQYRDRAIELAGEAWDIHAQAREKEAESGLFLRLCGYRLSRDEREEGWTPREKEPAEKVAEARAEHMAAETRRIDRGVWKHLIDATELERLMDKQAREEFHRQLQGDEFPEISVESVYTALEGFLGQTDEIFRRGIANVFSSLDRRFRSHDGFKVGHRIVLENAIIDGHWSYYAKKDETLRDVERTFYTLDGQTHPDRLSGIVNDIDQARGGMFNVRQFEVENAYFRVRGFKNGNLHIWFTRKDLVRQINRLLADYYGEVIAEGSDVADVSDMGPGYHVAPARNFGLFETNEDTARILFERAGHIAPGMRILEPSAGRGALADKARSAGASVHCVEIQDELAMVLKARGHEVTRADFLELTPDDIGTFDAVIMNPPFDRGRDCDHVRHALGFLKPGGWLAAIMSASAEAAEDSRRKSFRALVHKLNPTDRWDRRYFRDLPERSFAHAGTNVNTVTLVVRKPEATHA